ncbi:PREDICTED: uncharacterized protein LOC108764551 [Trachymyrmex cornetzi]|uniref:uncharacterized protein LOC108764551 n=1 Tax=Trachymyrmex cornetzi TaxID=471704 RepID=UPI00084F2E5D|nr:PREDICTED: uncharacterized protein LOC108764551 [Trachymyrmex cornetzi]
MGVDGIPNEVWKLGVRVWRECNEVWKGEGWPEEWKEGVVVPVRKKGQGEEIKDYRGVSIMPTMYKVYTAALSEKLREEVERKRLIPPNQTGFRKGMGTLDNVFVLNYLINKQVRKKERKLVALFVDLKAAFDSVDRGVLVKALRVRGVREGLMERVDEILRETKSRVRVGGKELGESFWTARGVSTEFPVV